MRAGHRPSELSGGRARRVEVYSTNAAVALRGGDVVYLEETPQGWRISAAGCRNPAYAKPADLRAAVLMRAMFITYLVLVVAGLALLRRPSACCTTRRPSMRFVRDNGLSIFFLAIFLARLAGQAIAGHGASTTTSCCTTATRSRSGAT